MTLSSRKIRALVTLGLAFSLTASAAEAAMYSIALEAEINGGKAILGNVIVADGDTGEFSAAEQGTTIRVTPVQSKDGVVKIQTEVLKMVRGGEKTIAHPAVIVRLDETAIVSERNVNGGPKVRLKLTPTLQ